MLKTFCNGGSTVASVNLLEYLYPIYGFPNIWPKSLKLSLLQLHPHLLLLRNYFLPNPSQTWKLLFFLFAAAWFHLKDGGVPSLRLPFSLCSPRLFSCHFWVPDLLLIPSATSWVGLCLPWDVLEMWPHHCWASKHNYLMFLRLPAGRSLLFGCVGTYWGPGTGTDPWVKEGDSISQSAAGIQKIFQWYFYHPTLCSYLFHYINCSSKGDLPRLRNHFSLICLPSLVMLKCSSTRDDITAVSENSFQN